MPRIRFEVNKLSSGKLAYQGGRACMDPDALLNLLAEDALTQAKWILRAGVVALLIEQLVMLELFGGCTLNMYDLRVPADIYAGLDRYTANRQPDGTVEDVPFVKPPRGYPPSPQPFPLELLTVTDKQRAALKQLRGTKAPKPLARLVQRMRDRWTRSPPVFILATHEAEPAATGGPSTKETEHLQRVP
eukprot:GHVT01092452.1.p1 GENE.GHVT01092452.1~~GHVT01092452.1.p1  ORF type:complete len:220 (+),score=23.98 GHVT01092452.1:94-660(+)